MQSLYDHNGVTIYQADCRTVLPCLSPGSIDLVLTDPPYGVTSLAWDTPVSSWPHLVRQLLASHGSLWCFGSLRALLATAPAFAGWKLAQDLVWEKHNGSGFQADRFRRVHEHIVQFYPASVRWSAIYKAPVTTADATRRLVRRKRRPPHLGGIQAHVYRSVDGGPRLMRSVIRARSCHGYALHPTQKPIEVLSPIVQYSCVPGGIVLDPFMGAGSTLVAACQLGRRVIGIERDSVYCRHAIQRIEQLRLTPPASGNTG